MKAVANVVKAFSSVAKRLRGATNIATKLTRTLVAAVFKLIVTVANVLMRTCLGAECGGTALSLSTITSTLVSKLSKGWKNVVEEEPERTSGVPRLVVDPVLSLVFLLLTFFVVDAVCVARIEAVSVTLPRTRDTRAISGDDDLIAIGGSKDY